MSKPNIIFFFSDQQRWDTVGAYGQKLDITPNLDKAAAAGTRFANTFTCQPVCGPARACLQTGKYATEVNCHTNHMMPPADEMILAPLMKDAGYTTAYIGKWHLASFGPKGGPDDFREKVVPPERRGGYEYWLASDCLEFTSHGYDGHMFEGDGTRREFPEGRFRADAQTDWVLEYLQNRDKEKPFFLFTSYIEPHHQNDRNRYEGPHGSKEKFAGYEVPGDLADTKGDWQENYPDYLGCCNALDMNFGRVVDELEKQGILDNTVIIYTSDHGSHFRTRNGEYKRSCHDGCTRVPLIAMGPGFDGGTVRDEMISLIDLPPTILAAAGIAAPGTMHGRPLQSLSDGNWTESIFLQISESQCGRAVRTRKWKYSVRAPERGPMDPDSDVYVEDFLYDLEADPHERNNLVADPALSDIRAKMKDILLKHMAEAGEETPEIKPAG